MVLWALRGLGSMVSGFWTLGLKSPELRRPFDGIWQADEELSGSHLSPWLLIGNGGMDPMMAPYIPPFPTKNQGVIALHAL